MFGGQVAGQALVAAGRTVDGPVVHSLHAYFLRPGDPTSRSSTRSTASATAGRSPPAASSPSSTARRSSTCRRRSSSHEDGPRPPAPDARRARRPRRCRRCRSGWRRTRDELGGWFARPRPIDIRYVDGPAADRTRGAAARRASGCGCAPTARCPTTRCCTPACVTYASRHDAARHRRCCPTAGARARTTLDDGQPRPRDVVPPAVPRRRVAALRPGHARRPPAAAAWPAGSIYTPRRRSSPCRSCRRA